MRTATAQIRLKPTSEGGKGVAIGNGGDFACPVYFEDVAELSAHAYDCRLLLHASGATIAPGGFERDIEIAFLSPDEVFPHLKVGVRFRLWEGRDIGEGEITSVAE